MDRRAELVRLIAEGTPPPDIIEFFITAGLGRLEIDHLLNDCGVQFRRHRPNDDGISEERRLYLQGLSTSED